jgi:PIN domain nuclease of toxin-antitoxin system
LEILDASGRAGLPAHVSPITAWELGLLAARGRLKSPLTPQRLFQRIMDFPYLRLAAMPPEILLASSFLPGSPPRDPADRIILATAREYG